MVAVDFNVLKDCKRRGHGRSTLASNDGRRRLFRAGIKLSGPSTQPLPKIGPNLIDDLGLPVLMSVVNETWTGQPPPHCFLFLGADIRFASQDSFSLLSTPNQEFQYETGWLPGQILSNPIDSHRKANI